MVLAARPRAPDGPAHVGLKLDAALLEGFYGSSLRREGGLRVGRCLRSRRREGRLRAWHRLRGEAERHSEEGSNYRDYETRTAPLSDRFPRAHVIPFPLVVLALFYYWKERKDFLHHELETSSPQTRPLAILLTFRRPPCRTARPGRGPFACRGPLLWPLRQPSSCRSSCRKRADQPRRAH